MKLNPRSAAVLMTLLSYGYATAQTASPPAPKADEPQTLDTVVISTGTRTSGLRAVDSPSPVQVIDGAALQRGGQPDVIQSLSRIVPSYTTDAKGGDAAALTTAARLRGLSPNHTLVLIDGKRRHGTANLNVTGSPYQGGASADLGLIPGAAISSIEVLQDGAAAQYGSDAIAGVINIHLRRNPTGGSVTADVGQYFDGGGNTYHASANLGLQPSASSFVNLTFDKKYRGHSDRSDQDYRFEEPYVTQNANGNLTTATRNRTAANVSGYPYLNHTFGDPSIQQELFTANAGVELGQDLALYSVLTAASKYGAAIQNYRGPSTAYAVYPQGFSPVEVHDETDRALTLGFKGGAPSGIQFDLSTTYGRNNANVLNVDSINTAWLSDKGSAQSRFDEGYLRSTQWVTNLDLSHDVAIAGWASPLNVSGGLEYRRDGYGIGQGELSSYYKGGAAAFPGYTPSDAGAHSRNSQALYLDLAGSPIKGLQLDGALRSEHFSDFGSSNVGKLSGRFQLAPTVALRGTASTGFRAPTLAEEYYSATQVSPNTATALLPSYAPAAQLLGFEPIKAEKSNNLSLGAVFTPTERLTASVDIYQILIRDRIIQSGSLVGTLGGTVLNQTVNDAITLNGNTLPSGITKTSVTVFTNGGDARTRGLDGVLTYAGDRTDWGRVDWSAALNINQTKLIKVKNNAKVAGGAPLLDQAAISVQEKAQPAYRLNLGALWRTGAWTVDLHENVYGPFSYYSSYDNVTYYENKISPKYTTDIDVNYAVNKAWSLSVGATNLFNVYPNELNKDYRQVLNDKGNQNVAWASTYSPIGINGGYYYARANYKF